MTHHPRRLIAAETLAATRAAGSSAVGRAAVCVPLSGRLDGLPGLVDALEAQRRESRLDVIFFHDARIEGARRAVEDACQGRRGLSVSVFGSRLAPAAAHEGGARRAAMDAGAAILAETGARDAVLLTTDADARPEPGWVGASLAAIDAGADAVAARLVAAARDAASNGAEGTALDRARGLAARLEDLIDPTPGDPWPRHGDHAGAGLAVRLSVYRAIRNCPAPQRREDLALVARIRRAGGVVRHAPEARVVVAGRDLADPAISRDAARDPAAAAAPSFPCPHAMAAHWRTRRAIRAEARALAVARGDPAPDRAAAAVVARLAPDQATWPQRASLPEALAALALLTAADDAVPA